MTLVVRWTHAHICNNHFSSSSLPLSSPSSFFKFSRAALTAGSFWSTPGPREPSNSLSKFLSFSSDFAASSFVSPCCIDICKAICIAASSSSSSSSTASASMGAASSPVAASADGLESPSSFLGSFSFMDMARACCRRASSSLSPMSMAAAAIAVLDGGGSLLPASAISASPLVPGVSPLPPAPPPLPPSAALLLPSFSACASAACCAASRS
mmetsp:Transcript_26063/g.72730  ORF Transcript_26063/g.72730 Transcript_26063/m.72730 type:complete len:212 (+) Transcript_26063:114-749(+)